jgi:hypothetical protein
MGMRVRLKRKFADRIDDVDLKGRSVGDILDLSERDAMLLVAEGWASLVDVSRSRRSTPSVRADACDSRRPGKRST